MQRSLLLAALFLQVLFPVVAQTASADSNNYKSRKFIVAGSGAALTCGSLVYLNQAWYSDYNTGHFHFFDDNKEWLQMDKVGHVYSNYQLSRLMMEAFDWARFSKQKTLWVGGTTGFLYMTAIECMDGFSKGWGFSWGDQLSNALGTGLAMSQRYFWNEQRVQLKFSFSESGLARYNPELLGKNMYTRVLKDYNGQTYWLSVNPSSFFKKESRFPKWLNLAIGYNAYGMLGGHSNSFVTQDEHGNVLRFERERRVLVSLDLDLSRIKTRSKFLKGLFSVIGLVKIPAPAIKFSKDGLKAYYFYF